MATEETNKATPPAGDDGGGPAGPEPAPPPPEDIAGLQKELARVRKEAATARVGNKDLAAKAAKYDELEESQKSDSEKLAARATAAEERAVEAEAKATRYEVALEKGLPVSMAARLVGSTKEELEADAAELVTALGGKLPAGPPSGKVSENLRPAGSGSGTPTDSLEPTERLKAHPRT